MGTLRRTHAAADITTALVGQEVVLTGWVQRRRDHGGVVFVDLRDREGLVQVVFKPDSSPECHDRAGQLRSEYVILVRGIVQRRSPDTVNPNLPTGEVEVIVHEVRLLNRATPPPFAIEDEIDVDEATRMRFRIHDLRRAPLQRALRLRHELYQAVRRSMTDQGFLEIETPMLAKSTPEGARDFLVPSRLQHGSFYALPQSPQIMKQLLMVAGFDRYFQIVRCFRDEDQRADRQLEFTQVDLEMAFVGVEEVLEVLEEVTVAGCAETADIALERPFPRLSYREAMDRYGSDRPDTRIQLELVDLSDAFADSEFRAFRAAVDRGGIVKCLPVHDAEELGLGWIRVDSDGNWQSPIAKFLSEDERREIAQRTGARPGSLLFFQADTAERANAILSRLRIDLGQRLGRVDGREWEVLFVVDFPLFERDENGQLTYIHQPFVAPLDEDLPLLDTDPERVRGTHYDVVMNGVELGSGSLRNHRSDVQRKIFDAGAPPHGGFAFGFDRWAMVLAGVESLRDVIAFPKTQRGQDLLMDAPDEVDAAQLDELGLKIQKSRAAGRAGSKDEPLGTG
jgi:aspartyl-tRNA synthetase